MFELEASILNLRIWSGTLGFNFQLEDPILNFRIHCRSLGFKFPGSASRERVVSLTSLEKKKLTVLPCSVPEPAVSLGRVGIVGLGAWGSSGWSNGR